MGADLLHYRLVGVAFLCTFAWSHYVAFRLMFYCCQLPKQDLQMLLAAPPCCELAVNAVCAQPCGHNRNQAMLQNVHQLISRYPPFCTSPLLPVMVISAPTMHHCLWSRAFSWAGNPISTAINHWHCVSCLHHVCFPRQARAKKQQAAAPKTGTRKAPKRPAGTVTLRGLIEEGLLAPADDVLTVEYKGMITHASLTAEGRIRFKGGCRAL